MQTEERVRALVRKAYWEDDINCARAMLRCLGGLTGIEIAPQTMRAAIGLHGAGGFRAQCGLVEGMLMFLGLHLSGEGKSEGEIASRCCTFAEGFSARFSSLQCRDLRPGGFREDDPPHACEELTVQAVLFALGFLDGISGNGGEKGSL